MKAWEVQGRGIESLKLVERPKPEEIADNQILVNIKAASLNYRDLIMIAGGYGDTGGNPPFVPISDGSGIVEAVGKGIKQFKKGEFQKGSIEPKIKAAMHFLKYHGEKVIVTSIPHIKDALDGKTGTVIRNET